MLTVRNPIDRETLPWVNFTIGAVDGGGNTQVIPISVEITDINDNNPKFDKDQFTGMVSENANVGTQVLIVTATDIDLGQFANLTYSLTGGNGAFTIDPVTVSGYLLMICEIYWACLFVFVGFIGHLLPLQFTDRVLPL